MALEWTAETFRLSLFFSEAVKATLADWTKITGQDEPETIQNVTGRRTMMGPFQGGILQVNASGPRIDCILLPKITTQAIEDAFVPNVGSVPKVFSDFTEAVTPWLAGFDRPVIRMAIGIALLAKCDSLRDAYAKLIEMLSSVNGDPERMKEIIFRINWPLSSKKVDGVGLNRITTWSVIQFQLQHLTQSGPTTVLNETVASNLIRLEIDHNTDVDRAAPFDQNVLVPIYEELVGLALENAEKGEVP